MRSQAERCAPHSHVGKSPLGAVDDANLMRAVHPGVIEHETRVGHAVHEHDAGRALRRRHRGFRRKRCGGPSLKLWQ